MNAQGYGLAAMMVSQEQKIVSQDAITAYAIYFLRSNNLLSSSLCVSIAARKVRTDGNL